MKHGDAVRVLLLWPGGVFVGGGNFGVPQMLSLANALQRTGEASVRIVDLDMERAFGGWSVESARTEGYDIIGLSCYSSYDYLKIVAIAERLRKALPKAWLVVGGYHASARPKDFLYEGAPFDYVVVGDGEHPLARLAMARAQGKRPLERVLGPDSVKLPGEYLPYSWELLERYRPIARRMASQAEVYLSRGCPYDCSFCMERAKRDVSWRSLAPEDAVEELHRLDAFLDLSTWTLFIADALFGMKRAWRRAFLEALVRRPIRAQKLWLLIRVDLIEREDLELMARANVAPGFGLESGDPEQLGLIRKSGKLDDYLEKMLAVSEWAREFGVPFGANVIVGHPGETEARLRRSAAYLRKLFLDSRGTFGFLSVDRFRLYPGSPIDEQRELWEARTGMRVHRPEWWLDGDQDFLAEWVDPSQDLNFRRTTTLAHELFAPLVREIRGRFAYTGRARDYFLRSIDDQVELWSPRARLRQLGLFHLWQGLVSQSSRTGARKRVREDGELTHAARAARIETLDAFSQGCRSAPDPILNALEVVPRERFVSIEDIEHSSDDRALALVPSGRSTISALHAYRMAFDLLELRAGDRVADLGGGSGYGAALASEIVGPEGSVVSVECLGELVQDARENLADRANVSVVHGDASDCALWRGANKIYCAFAVPHVPDAWLASLPEGGRLVLPLEISPNEQALTLFARRGGEILRSLGPRVAYVQGQLSCVGFEARTSA